MAEGVNLDWRATTAPEDGTRVGPTNTEAKGRQSERISDDATLFKSKYEMHALKPLH